jgi:hypothetical protein
MRCSDTLLAFVTFFAFGVVLAVLPSKIRDIELSIRSWIPLGNFFMSNWVKSKGYIRLIRIQGIIIMGLGLFFLQWHLRRCM